MAAEKCPDCGEKMSPEELKKHKFTHKFDENYERKVADALTNPNRK